MKIVLDKGAVMPTRAHPYDAGLDLYTPVDVTVPGCMAWEEYGKRINLYEAEAGSAVIDTGVHLQIPESCVGFIKSKSGLNVNHGLTAEGVIDCGYTGSIRVKLYNHTTEPYHFKAGDKIAQLVILPCVLLPLEEVDSLEDTERGEGGFGSTGR